jgi:hypothetical protein
MMKINMIIPSSSPGELLDLQLVLVGKADDNDNFLAISQRQQFTSDQMSWKTVSSMLMSITLQQQLISICIPPELSDRLR